MESGRYFRPGISSVAIAVACLVSGAVAQAADKTETFEGEAVKVGNGTARTIVRADSTGQLVSIGIAFTEQALEGLPVARKKGPPDFAYPLPMPKQGPRSLIDHVVVNWEPKGHSPSKVYDVPHFDFHFYLVSRTDRMKVKFKSDAASGDPGQLPPPELLPTGYIVPPGTAVPQMGVHAVNPASAEFHGQPFTTTFIYGYYNKKLTFFEPMVSLAFLKSKPEFSAPVARPAMPPEARAYPSRYSLRYDQASKIYALELEGMSLP